MPGTNKVFPEAWQSSFPKAGDRVKLGKASAGGLKCCDSNPDAVNVWGEGLEFSCFRCGRVVTGATWRDVSTAWDESIAASAIAQ